MGKENKKNLIAVPVDFTKRSDCAIKHAAKIAKTCGDEILLIHIINRESKTKLKKEGGDAEEVALAKLQTLCNEIEKKHGVKANFTAPEGSIFTDIGKVTEESEARMMVMGTHGVVGLEQKILGAWALKVVTSSPVPVIIVQEKNPSEQGYKNILFPVDYNKESRQMLLHIADRKSVV